MKKAHKIAEHQPKTPFFRYHPLACVLLLAVAPTQADDYFDPSFLGVVGENTDVDLSAFSQAGGIAEGEYTVSVFVNQQDVGQFALNFIKNAQGDIAPELTPEQLDTFGVNVPHIPVLKDLPKGELISDLGALIPQATTQ